MHERRDPLDAASEFLQLLDAWTPGRDLHDLVRALDELAVATHGWPAPEYVDDVPETGLTDAVLRARLGPSFPELGLYPVAIGEPGEAQIGLGDAIDDLIDLTHELARSRMLGGDAGRDYFAWSHRVHWGQHLRELQLHLHNLRRPSGGHANSTS